MDNKGSKEKEKDSKKIASAKDYSVSYNRYKFFEGQQYTGMQIGRRHRWYYDKGEWHDRKLTPDKWEIEYIVTKRRAGKAPEGSGAPVGTEYDWFILAHQVVKKLNADDYTTTLRGFKFKIAHKRAGSEKWSASDNARAKRLIKVLAEMIEDVKREPALAIPPSIDAKPELPKAVAKALAAKPERLKLESPAPAKPDAPKAPGPTEGKKARSRRVKISPKRKAHRAAV